MLLLVAIALERARLVGSTVGLTLTSPLTGLLCLAIVKTLGIVPWDVLLKLKRYGTGLTQRTNNGLLSSTSSSSLSLSLSSSTLSSSSWSSSSSS